MGGGLALKEKIIKLSIYYIIGFIIFLTGLRLSETIILKIIGLDRKDVILFMDSFVIHLLIYTICFITISVCLYLYDKISIRGKKF